MAWQLDHVFVTVPSPDEPCARLRAAGLVEGSPNTHPGQGTANRRFFFDDMYLELLFLVDLAQARDPAMERTRLADRCTRTELDWGRLGFALRGAGGPPFATWGYQPPYLPSGASIRMGDNSERLDEPLLFLMLETMPRVRASGGGAKVLGVELGPGPPMRASATLAAFLERGVVKLNPEVTGVRITLAGSGTDRSLLPESPLEVCWAG